MTTSPSPATTPNHAFPDFGRLATVAVWGKSIPERLREVVKTGEPAEVWTAWVEHLRRRKTPRSLEDLLGVSTSPLGWAAPMDGQVDRAVAGYRSCHGDLEALARAHALPRLAGEVSAEVWWGELGRLYALAVEAQRLEPAEQPLVHALAAGELPLTLAYLFPEIAACRGLLKPGCRALSTGLVEVLDGAGLVQAARWDLMRPLLACWTRCRAMGELVVPDGKSCLSPAAATQYDWAVHQALRWSRPDGSQTLGCGPSSRWSADLFRAAVRFDSDETDRDLAAVVLPGGQKRSRSDREGPLALDETATHSEWAAAAMLRTGWDASQPALSVLYPGREVLAECVSHGEVLWSGRWECEVHRDGRLLEPVSDWEEVCWVSDEDVDYLELEIELADGLLVQRQMILAREDRFLLLADSVLGDEPGGIDYRGRLPLARGVVFEPEAETREGRLVGRRPAAMVLPLALGEWRSADTAGSLEQTSAGLELRQATGGQSLAGLLFFDLDPRRFARKLTWRRLTVAESLAVVPEDVAVGCRVAIGRQQWLFYRSLALPANRTVLGHNLATETLLARFDQEGEVHPLVEVV